MQNISSLIVLGALATMLSGCVIALGNRDFPPPKTTRTTAGQELTDLKKARDAGAISDEEYAAQKKRILGEPGHR